MTEEQIKAKAEYFLEFWPKQTLKSTREQKDQLGVSYMKHVLGLDDKTIKAFLNDDNKSHSLVGNKQANTIQTKNDYESFWKDVSEIFEGDYSEDDVKFLSEQKKDCVISMLNTFNFDLTVTNYSPVLEKLSINAHAYK